MSFLFVCFFFICCANSFYLSISLSLHFVCLCKNRPADDTILFNSNMSWTDSVKQWVYFQITILTVIFRGTSNNSSMAACSETFSDLHELRSLAPSANIMALTATATHTTRETIMDVLLMNHPHVIFESPGKPNTAYSVYYIPKDRCWGDYLQWLSDELLTEKELTTRTVIYCETIKQCGLIYSTLEAMLGKKIFLDETGDNPRDVIVEMLHSCTPAANKAVILQSFQVENSSLRVLVVTIAFGRGWTIKVYTGRFILGHQRALKPTSRKTGRAGKAGK